MSDASSTTWFAVIIWPWALTTTPLPILLSLSLATLVSMNTSDGAMIRYTFAPYSGVAGVDVGGVAAAGRFVLPSDDEPSTIAYAPSAMTAPTAAQTNGQNDARRLRSTAGLAAGAGASGTGPAGLLPATR